MAIYPKITLTIDGEDRDVRYRVPAQGDPNDAIIVCHGAGGHGNKVMNRVHDEPGVLWVGPDALEWTVRVDGTPGPSRRWIVPGEYGRPGFPATVDDKTDIRFMVTLAGAIRSRYPTVQRVYLTGFSSGGKLTWFTLHADGLLGQTSVDVFDGYFVLAHGMARALASWTPLVRPLGLWYGTEDPARSGSAEVFSFDESVEEMRATFGCSTGYTEWPINPCCNNKPLHVRLYDDDPVGFVPSWHQGGYHVFCQEDGSHCHASRVITRFLTEKAGLGSA